MKQIKYFVLTIAVLLAQPVLAAVSPVSISVVPPIQFPPSDFSVTGVRASVIWGQHRDIYGIDVGLIGNITEQTFTGVAVSGIFNYTKGTTTALGAQLAGLANINQNKTRVIGVQAALGANMNNGESSIFGLQLALANLSQHTTIYGFQVGAYNKAKAVYGLQVGIINSAANLHGLQIGLLNIHEQGVFKYSPVLNFGF